MKASIKKEPFRQPSANIGKYAINKNYHPVKIIEISIHARTKEHFWQEYIAHANNCYNKHSHSPPKSAIFPQKGYQLSKCQKASNGLTHRQGPNLKKDLKTHIKAIHYKFIFTTFIFNILIEFS